MTDIEKIIKGIEEIRDEHRVLIGILANHIHNGDADHRSVINYHQSVKAERVCQQIIFLINDIIEQQNQQP